jgi:hypothetical protein
MPVRGQIHSKYPLDQTGQSEVWIRPFPGPGSPIRVSPSGGHDPVWSRDGKELFYQNSGKLMSVEVNAQKPELRMKPPRELFEGGFVLLDRNTAHVRRRIQRTILDDRAQ